MEGERGGKMRHSECKGGEVTPVLKTCVGGSGEGRFGD